MFLFLSVPIEITESLQESCVFVVEGTVLPSSVDLKTTSKSRLVQGIPYGP